MSRCNYWTYWMNESMQNERQENHHFLLLMLTRITVPINNKCPDIGIKHVDLSQGAFAYLEPKFKQAGIGRNATITYVFCNSTTVYTPPTGTTANTTPSVA
uniref:Uncharacterized protein n=1 Tax=Ditylenchus dipsaci TaxID=166011 RepID=A0A915DQW2_9BILA